MTQPMHRFLRIARKCKLATDERGLSTVEYVIILVLIAAAAVGTWTTFGKTITSKSMTPRRQSTEPVSAVITATVPPPATAIFPNRTIDSIQRATVHLK